MSTDEREAIRNDPVRLRLKDLLWRNDLMLAATSQAALGQSGPRPLLMPRPGRSRRRQGVVGGQEGVSAWTVTRP